jgi:hypothetical protein
MDRLRDDMGDLYQMDREMRDRVARIEATVATLVDDKKDRQFGLGAITGVIGGLVGIGALVVSLIR